ETIPRELEGSGLVDGCTRLQVYRRIVLPMSGPGLVASGAFTFMLCWNEFVIAQVLNSKPTTTTLPPIIAGMMRQAHIYYSVTAASGFLSALPAVLLAVVFQRYMVQGLTAGSVKGGRAPLSALQPQCGHAAAAGGRGARGGGLSAWLAGGPQPSGPHANANVVARPR